MSSLDDGWDSTVSAWAHAQSDIQALVQIGSRVQKGAAADRWSDYDYHLVTSSPRRYRDGSFSRGLGTCWACGSQVAFGNAVKVTAVYAGALEADFVILSHWEVRVAALALALPGTAPFWPGALSAGVASLRVVAAPGWKVIKGGGAEEEGTLKPGDWIVAVSQDGTNFIEIGSLTLATLTQKIKGRAGTKVWLRYRRENQTHTIVITRRRIVPTDRARICQTGRTLLLSRAMNFIFFRGCDGRP